MLEFIDRVVIPFFLSLYDAVGYVGVAVAIGLETFVPIIPSEVIVPMAGWKVSQSAVDPSVLEPLTHAPWNWIAVLLIATAGAVAGSLAGYLIGPGAAGRCWTAGAATSISIPTTSTAPMPGSPATATGPSSSAAWFPWCARSSTTRPASPACRSGRFLLFSALGSLPWNAALLLGGYLLGENYRTLYDAIRPYELVIYALVVVGIAWVIWRWLRGGARGEPGPTPS